MRRLILKIQKFFYYGRAGMKCYDFDAGSISTLMLAHIKRVRKFMDSDNTHLRWNSDRQGKGLMRKLYEFEEICTRIESRGGFNNYYYFSEVRKRYPNIGLFSNNSTPEYRKECRVAMKKDNAVAKQLEERYVYMIKHYVPMFWD